MNNTGQPNDLKDSTKRLIFVVIAMIALAGIVVWIVSGFGISTGEDNGPSSIKAGADEIGQLIQQQTQRYQEVKQNINNRLQEQLKSQALLLPDGVIEDNEQPSSILYLNSRYQEKGIDTELKQIEFYKKATLAYFHVTLTQDHKTFLNAALGSVLSQTIGPGNLKITYQPIFQAGTPAELKTGKPLDVMVMFKPLRPDQKFELILGDFLSDQDPDVANHFAAHFSVDPRQIIKEQNPSGQSDNGSTEPIN